MDRRKAVGILAGLALLVSGVFAYTLTRVRREGPLHWPAPDGTTLQRLGSLSPECRRAAKAALDADVDELGFELRYRFDPQTRELPRRLGERLATLRAAGRCDDSQPGYATFRDSCENVRAGEGDAEQRYQRTWSCLASLRAWRGKLAAQAWEGVAPARIEDPGAVAAIFSADLLPEIRTDDDSRMHELAKRLTELLPRSREAAVYRLQTALHLASETELRAAIAHLQQIDPRSTRLIELDLARLGKQGEADTLAARAREGRNAHPDSFLGSYYTAYALALKGDRAAAINELQAYVDRVPDTPLVQQALAALQAGGDAKPAEIFVHRNETLFPEQFDADEVTGQLRFSPH